MGANQSIGRTGEKIVVHQITVQSTDNAHSFSHTVQPNCEVILLAQHVIDLKVMFEKVFMSTYF